MKNIVLHDYFESAEGGGRLSSLLARELEADLAYGFKTDDHPFFQKNTFTGKEYTLCPYTAVPIWRQFKLTQAFRRQTEFLDQYKNAIYSGFYAPLAVQNHKQGPNIYYCHTPPRFIYDQRLFYLSLIPKWQRPVLYAFCRYLQPLYEKAVKKMDIVITNSKNVQARIKRFLNLDSLVVYPPCDTEKFKWLGQEDYYLSTARLDPLKRVDYIVEAFCNMPDKKLIVVSDGPELEKIRKLAAEAKNIYVLGQVRDDKLTELLGRCIATIYIPKDEDFGMSPVESMAAGKPVIGIQEGGIKESVIHGETGYLIEPEPDMVKIIEGILTLSPGEAKKMRHACVERAQLFRKEFFLKRMGNLISA